MLSASSLPAWFGCDSEIIIIFFVPQSKQVSNGKVFKNSIQGLLW